MISVKPEGIFKQALYAIYERSQRRIDNEQLANVLCDPALNDREFSWIRKLVPSFWKGKASQSIATKLSEIGERRDVEKME